MPSRIRGGRHQVCQLGNEECYLQKIQPRLRTIKIREISEAMHVSKPYAAQVRAGRRRPYPRHWQALAGLVGVALGVAPDMQKEREAKG